MDEKTHILVFPFPAQGHMLPLLDLTQKLATHGGLTITVLVTPKNLPLLNPLLSSTPSIKTLVLPFPTHPSVPPGVENSKDLPPTALIAFMRALGDLHEPLLHWFRTHPSPPVAIVSDMFLGWTHSLASQLGIQRVVFSPSGAMALAVIYSLWRDMPDVNEGKTVTFSGIPNCPKYPSWQLSPIHRSYVAGDPVSEFTKEGFLADVASWGLVVSSFDALEGVYLDHLKETLGHDRVWAVAPLHHHPIGPTERGGPTSMSPVQIKGWLDTCHDHSVVYVCFGSQVVLSNNQMEQLALGLEKSGVRFIWGVKSPTIGHVDGQEGRVPIGFQDRVAGRGLVIHGWAPQISILSHRAVAAFLGHGGWNSIMEAVVAGVPILGWPMGADQYVNVRLVVDELKVAKRVCEGAKTVPDSDELARVLIESVSDDGAEMDRVKRLSEEAFAATKAGGSSQKSLDGLIRSLIKLKTNVFRFEQTNE